jgi:sigma-B regulation protein RsbU (phosphoserine phosphatase)
MAEPMTRSRGTYLQFCALALLFVWVVCYQAGPARAQFQAAWANNHSSVDRVLDPIFDWVVPLFAIGFGFAVAVVKIRDLKAWLLLGLLLSFAETIRLGPNVNATSPWLRTAALAYADDAHLWLAWFFFFLIYFPARMAIDARWPWLKWLIVAPSTLRAILFFGQDLGIAGASRIMRAGGAADVGVEYGFTACFLVLLSLRYFTAETADQRRRLSLFYWGTLVTLVPVFVLGIVRIILHRPNFGFAPFWLLYIVFGLVALFPAVLAYVILVQRAMDVRFVIRQGLRYALVRRGVLLLPGLAAGVLIWAFLTFVNFHTATRAIVFVAVALAIGLVLLARKVASALALSIDRRFFRDAYSAEQILSELAEKIRTIVEIQPLLEMVTQRVADSLHVPRVAVLLNDGGIYRPAYALGYGGLPSTVLLQDTPIVKMLRRGKQPARVYFDDPDSWIYRTPEMTEGDRGQLTKLQSELLLPLGVTDELVGFMSLSQKLSEAPYSGTDLHLLSLVAAQTGSALEIARLTAVVGREIAQRERMNREMEIAREVQQGLLPQGGPNVPGLEYAGVCRPALSVGGDYYDFLRLPDGRFGFAIGDVSGKGFAAALLMASLQASLRGQTFEATDDLAAVLTRMNKLLFEATAPNRYATFFYAQYDPLSRKLTWVNAGHNAPVLFRRGEIRKLHEGGPVIGLLPDVEYFQASTELASGDLVVAYTDGISEAMNANDEEWGEERLYAAVARFAEGLPVPTLLDRLLECADAHAGGVPQHDDMTLIAIHALPVAFIGPD